MQSGDARPVRLRLSRTKGFDLQAHSRAKNGLEAVNCARPGPFGNPFMVDCYGRAGAVDRFARLMAGQMSTQETSTSSHYGFGSLWSDRRRILAGIPKLRGRNLACWCPLVNDEPDCCHAAVLLRLASTQPERGSAPAARDEGMRERGDG